MILGATASGKTGVSIEIAQEIECLARENSGSFAGVSGVEIISADSGNLSRNGTWHSGAHVRGASRRATPWY